MRPGADRRKRWRPSAPLASALLALGANGVVHAEGATLNCTVGPLFRIFGSVPWLVYSCTDGRTLVLVSAPGSPAAPFSFMLSPEGESYHLRGEGTGSQSATDGALKELQALTAKDIETLIRQTQAVKK